LDDYFKLREKVFEYFGYREDWRKIPLDDARGTHWLLIQDENGRGYVVFSDKPLTRELILEGDIYGNEIYTQRFLPKWVYRAEDFTMICVDTHTDGNQFLSVFDNSMEVDDDELRALYVRKWVEEPMEEFKRMNEKIMKPAQDAVLN